MALAPDEVRAKIDVERHRTLSAIAYARKRKLNELLVEAIDMLIAEEVRKAHEGKLLLRMLGDKGSDRESEGNKLNQ